MDTDFARDREKLIRDLCAFVPWNAQEECDRAEILALVENGGQEIFTRENAQMHLTASAWVCDPGRQKILMVYHSIYRSWSWMGGHADGDADLSRVALREVREESGLHARLLSPEIFSVEVLTVDGHEKRGKYVGSHLHLNVTYLMEGDPEAALRIKEDENRGVAWFEAAEAVQASSEPWFRERIYSKLNQKLAAFGRR